MTFQVNSVSAPTGVQTTRRPTITFNYTCTARWDAEIKVFLVSLAVSDPTNDTRYSFYRSIRKAGSAGTAANKSIYPGTDQVRKDNWWRDNDDRRDTIVSGEIIGPPGNDYDGDYHFKAYVRVRQYTTNNSASWSSWVVGPSFSIYDPPPAPYTYDSLPTDGQVFNTSEPTFTFPLARADFDQSDSGVFEARQKGVWQVSNEPQFLDEGVVIGLEDPLELPAPTTYTFVENDTDLKRGTAEVTIQEIGAPAGSFAEMTVPEEYALAQGTWYIRWKQQNQFGERDAAPWSGTRSFVISHAPSAALNYPQDAKAYAFGTGASCTVQFGWSFSDAYANDSQSALQVVVEKNSDGSTLFDSGKITGASTTYVVNFSQYLKETLLRWKVRVYDEDDVVSEYSDYGTFQLLSNPGASVTAPAEGATINNPTPEITWNYASDGGRSQQKYRVAITRISDGATMLDTGWLLGSTTTYQPADPVLDNAEDYRVTVLVADTEGLTASDYNDFDTSWVPPDTPLFTLVDASAFDTTGYVDIAWTDDERDANFIAFVLWRKEVGDADYEAIYVTSDISETYSYHDWLVGSGVTYQYQLTQLSLEFEAQLSSLPSSASVTPVSDNYWLIDKDDEALSMKVFNVTDETISNPFERNYVHLIGRGRHVDIGDRMGYTGSLTIQLWDRDGGLTAREQRQQFEAIAAGGGRLYLRNPFGDVYRVDAGDMDFQRMTGVGVREFGTITLPYAELEE